jgi:type I restriction enzyme S subunit
MNAELLLEHYEKIAEAPDAIPKLRRFILDLAVRGKLVPQDPNDEPADELLKRIEAEKKRVGVKPKSSSSQKIQPPFHLPTGWVWSNIGDISSKTGSGSTPRGGKDAYKDSGIVFLRSQNVHNDGLRLFDCAFIDIETHDRMSATKVLPGDLLLNITGGSIGRCCRVHDDVGDANVSQHVAIIRPAVSGLQHFFHYLILSPYFQSFVFSEQTGAGRGGLPKNKMDQIVVPLPPLAEQQRIVAKVDELMGICDRLEGARKEREAIRDGFTTSTLGRLSVADESTFRSDASFAIEHLRELTTRPDQIKQLRQAILNLAVRGKIVPQDPNDKAINLITRIKQSDTNQSFFEVPKNWLWVALSDIAEIENGDRGKNYPNRDEYVRSGIPWINTGHIQPNGSLSLESMNYIAREKYNQLRGGKIKPGDLIYCLRGATFGKTAFVEPFIEGAIASSLMIIRPTLNVDKRYLYYYLMSPLAKLQLLRFDNGTAQPNLSSNSVKRYFVPLPPQAEQLRIVAMIQKLFMLCDQTELSISRSQEATSDLVFSLVN